MTVLLAALFATSQPALAATAPKPEMFDTVCSACHTVGGGVKVGPDLAGVAGRKSPADLDRWLKDPQAYKPGTIMPKLDMTDAQRAAFVKWLSTLK